MLPVARPGAAAGLVQVGALSLARGLRSARGAERLRASSLHAETEIRVWDSTAEVRYLVVPMRPDGTDGWSEERLATLVTRDSMIGTGRPGGAVNGAHDMGGAHGFGPVVAEPDEPAFHAEWERRVFALTIALGASGEWNIDASRFAREDRPPAEYLDKSYYELWLAGLERLLAERGVLERPPARVLAAEDVAGDARPRRAGLAPRTTPGAVRASATACARCNVHPHGHTRLPRYARGRVGTVERVHGCHVFPDRNAHFEGEDPQWLYTRPLQRPRAVGHATTPAVGLDRRLRALPGGGVTEEPVFAEPWEAQAFALAVSLNERGLFTLERVDGGGRRRARGGLLRALAGDARAARDRARADRRGDARRATATRGSTRRRARRTARRSSSTRRTSMRETRSPARAGRQERATGAPAPAPASAILGPPALGRQRQRDGDARPRSRGAPRCPRPRF